MADNAKETASAVNENTERPASATRAQALGDVLAILLDSPRHATMTLDVFARHVVPAIERGQFTILRLGEDKPAGAAVAWWALVSPEAEKRIAASREQFVTLRPADWRCGPQPWIIDAVGDRQAVDDLIKQLLTQNFTNAAPKMRAILADGRIVIGRIEPKSSPESAKPQG